MIYTKHAYTKLWSIVVLLLVLTILVKIGLGLAVSATPVAGTLIGNQASASYVDALGVSRTVTSNTVETKVTEKFGFLLTANNAKVVAPGATVYFPHTIINAGNTADSFKLKATALTGAGTTTVATCSS